MAARPVSLRDRLHTLLHERRRPQVGRSTDSAPRLFCTSTHAARPTHGSTFKVEGVTARGLQTALWKRRVRVRPQNDVRGVRLSAHIYMSPADVDTVLDVASRLA